MSQEPLPQDMSYKAQQVTEDTEEGALAGLDLSRLSLVVKRSIIWILVIFISCLAASVSYLRYTKPSYQSSSILKLEPKNESVVLGLDNFRESHSSSNIRHLIGEIEFIRSELVYEHALEQLKLDISFFAKGKILDDEKYVNAPFVVQYHLKQKGFENKKFNIHILDEENFELSFAISPENTYKKPFRFGDEVNEEGLVLVIERSAHFHPDLIGSDFYFLINSKEHLISMIERNLQVEILNADANTLKISYTDHVPEKAKDIVDHISTVYLQQTLQHKAKTQEQTLRFLEETLENTEAKLAAAEQRLESFMRSNKTIDVKGDVSRLVTKLDELEKARFEMRMRIALVNDLHELVSKDKDLKGLIPALGELHDENLYELASQLSELQQKKAIALSRSKENTYMIRSMDLSLENLRASIMLAIEQSKKVIDQQLKQLTDKIAEQERFFLSLPGKETEFTRLKRFYNLYEKYYLLLMEKKAEFSISRAGLVPNFVVLSPASVPSAPIHPERFMIYLFAIGAATVMSMLLMVIRYMLHDTITSQIELERHLPVPFLGVIPKHDKKMEVSTLIVHEKPKASISEALRSIRTNLEFISPQKIKRISVTSTVSGEGKTFVTVNLAAIIALSGQRVIVIDLDMRKPKVHLAFNKENIVGCSNILIGKQQIGACIQKTDLPGLDFISAGAIPPNPSELILRPEFDAMLQALSQQYDTIVIDTPPIGLVTDGILIMKKVDVPLYVVRANYSKKAVVKTIRKVVETTGFKRFAVLLNAADQNNAYGYGGYGYGYGYGGGYYEDQEAPRMVDKVKNFLSL